MQRAALFLFAGWLALAGLLVLVVESRAETFTRIEWITRIALDEYLFDAFAYPPVTTRLSKLNARSRSTTEAGFHVAEKLENLGIVRASWYGGGEPLNKHTANGDVFDTNAMRCSHRTLPFGTRVRVTRVNRSWLSVDCWINDRGPHRRTGRALDLTKAAARKIELIRIGEAEVKLEIVR